MKFYDREDELAELLRIQGLAINDYSKMTIVTGRRRIGKTSLITKAMESDGATRIPTLYLFVSRKSEAVLCRDFANEASRVLGSHFPLRVGSFGELFKMLCEAGQHRAYNLIIDEFQEFDSINPSIFSDMQNYWDQFRKRTRINLIISGSVYSLMHKIFRDAKEPLFGRADNMITLRAFPPSTLKKVLSDNSPRYTNDDLLALYSFTGGVAKYVELFCDSHALTVDAMIEFMARTNSPFLDEGKNLLITELGKNYGVYFSILQALSEGATTQSRIEGVVGKRSISGHIKRLIEDYGILAHKRPIMAKGGSQTVRYELSDNFLHLWFAYFEKHRSLVEIGNTEELCRIMKDSYSTYSGLMLERYFRELLAETKGYREIGSWWEAKDEQSEIDIVALKLEKNQALAVEVKRKQENFRITKLQDKVDRLRKKDMPAYQFELKCLTLEDM
jgi:AAA+ ATPase superfamily predicted ATPase